MAETDGSPESLSNWGKKPTSSDIDGKTFVASTYSNGKTDLPDHLTDDLRDVLKEDHFNAVLWGLSKLFPKLSRGKAHMLDIFHVIFRLVLYIIVAWAASKQLSSLSYMTDYGASTPMLNLADKMSSSPPSEIASLYGAFDYTKSLLLSANAPYDRPGTRMKPLSVPRRVSNVATFTTNFGSSSQDLNTEGIALQYKLSSDAGALLIGGKRDRFKLGESTILGIPLKRSFAPPFAFEFATTFTSALAMGDLNYWESYIYLANSSKPSIPTSVTLDKIASDPSLQKEANIVMIDFRSICTKGPSPNAGIEGAAALFTVVVNATKLWVRPQTGGASCGCQGFEVEHQMEGNIYIHFGGGSQVYVPWTVQFDYAAVRPVVPQDYAYQAASTAFTPSPEYRKTSFADGVRESLWRKSAGSYAGKFLNLFGVTISTLNVGRSTDSDGSSVFHINYHDDHALRKPVWNPKYRAKKVNESDMPFRYLTKEQTNHKGVLNYKKMQGTIPTVEGSIDSALPREGFNWILEPHHIREDDSCYSHCSYTQQVLQYGFINPTTRVLRMEMYLQSTEQSVAWLFQFIYEISAFGDIKLKTTILLERLAASKITSILTATHIQIVCLFITIIDEIVLLLAVRPRVYLSDIFSYIIFFSFLFQFRYLFSLSEMMSYLQGIVTGQMSDSEYIDQFQECADDRYCIISEKYTVLSTMRQNMATLGIFMCLHTMLVFKYVGSVPLLSLPFRTFALAANGVSALMAALLAMVLGFSFLFHAMFGNYVEDFATVASSFWALMDNLGGTYDNTNLVKYYPSSGPSVLLVFNCFMGWIVLNVFVAVVMDSYSPALEQCGAHWAEQQDFQDHVAKEIKKIMKTSSKLSTQVDPNPSEDPSPPTEGVAEDRLLAIEKKLDRLTEVLGKISSTQ